MPSSLGRCSPCSTTRQDIYTDPQKPVAVEPKLYAVGEVGPESPLLVTTNFSLSYYSVEGEVEASRVPAYILSVDTEGTSVLTAWASDKFNADTITKALKKSEIEASCRTGRWSCRALWPCSRPASKTSRAGPSRSVRKRPRACRATSKKQWKPK